LSGIFFAIVLIAFLVAAYRQVTGETVIVDDGVQTPMEALSTAACWWSSPRRSAR
jgi:hypothetical protein